MMKLNTILLVSTLLLCCSGIASAANDTDMSKMIDMGEVKEHSMAFWGSIASVGNLILGAALAVTILLILTMIIMGAGKSALGKKSGDSNASNEGRTDIKNSIFAALGLVIGILVVAVLFGLL